MRQAGTVALLLLFVGSTLASIWYGPVQGDYARGAWWLVLAVLNSQSLDRNSDRQWRDIAGRWRRMYYDTRR